MDFDARQAVVPEDVSLHAADHHLQGHLLLWLLFLVLICLYLWTCKNVTSLHIQTSILNQRRPIAAENIFNALWRN